MNLQTFLEHFNPIAEAPNGIPKLRSLILDLAVRGKLVPQNPEDESALKLYNEIVWERQKLIQEKKIRSTQKLQPVETSEEFFEIPFNWQWVRLDDIGDWGAGSTPLRSNSDYYGGSHYWFKSGELPDGFLRSSSEETVTNLALQECSLRLNQIGDVLIAMYGATIGKLAILETSATTNQAVCACTCFSGIYNRYLFTFLLAWRKNFALMGAGAAQPNISRIKIIQTPFPLPPLAEQKRIVEKVDELMALCDRLQAAKQTRDTLRQKLRGSAIDSLMNAETDEELQKGWAIIRDNWVELSQSPEDVGDLRRSVLYLAVRGKLVPQNINDEPAEKLLKTIATHHSADSKKFRKPKNLLPIGNVDKPFDLPYGWDWCRFTDIGLLERGKSKHRPRNDPALYEHGSIPLIQTGDVARANGLIATYTALYNKNGLAQSRLWSKGTLCITIAANIGDTAILGFDACFPDSVVGFLPTAPIEDSRYFEFFLRTLKSSLENFAPSTAQKNINLAILDEVLIPVPPLAEQKRIVAKVDELMQMCDRLEESLRQSQQQAEALAASAIAHLNL